MAHVILALNLLHFAVELGVGVRRGVADVNVAHAESFGSIFFYVMFHVAPFVRI